jgi:DNA-binding transcriptional regulator YiaG
MAADSPTPPGAPPPHAARLIRAWRQRVGLTQEGLAQALSVTFSTVSRWENGHVLPSRLAWRALQRLAAERGHPLEGGEGDEGDGSG